RLGARLLPGTYRQRVGRHLIVVRIRPGGLDRFLFPIRLRHFRVERFQLRTHRILLCSWRNTILSASGTGMIPIVLGGSAMSTVLSRSCCYEATAGSQGSVDVVAAPVEAVSGRPVGTRTRLRGLGRLYRR